MGDKCVYSCTSRVHRKPKCDTHGHFFLILGNITILTTLSTPGRSLPGHFTMKSMPKKGVFFPLTCLSLIQTKVLIKRY